MLKTIGPNRLNSDGADWRWLRVTAASPVRLPARVERPLWLFASLWSLRQYPTRTREWSWAKKISAIRAAGFNGVFSPPLPVLRERGALRYLAVTSLDAPAKVAPALSAAKELGALAIDVQLGDYDTALADAVALAVRIRSVARELALPFAIETHRDTFTETPEATLALCKGYRAATGETLPLCLDHSHFAVIRHLAPAVFWERLRKPVELLKAATQFHLRPFNGHHCQIPVLDRVGRRTPEYRDWQRYAAALFAHLRAQPTTEPVLVVPELGHAAPAYRLSCFPDTWRDVVALARDVRRLWSSDVTPLKVRRAIAPPASVTGGTPLGGATRRSSRVDQPVLQLGPLRTECAPTSYVGAARRLKNED